MQQRHLLLLSTCGTSLLTNGAPPEVLEWLRRNANRRELAAQDADLLEQHAEARAQRLLAAPQAEQRRMSAELNGIAAVLSQSQPRVVEHVLVHADTALGTRAMHLVRDVLLERRQAVLPLTAGGLRTDRLEEFRAALSALTTDLAQLIEHHPSCEIVFNLTGGFKSINAYLQSVGMMYADRCVFLFENASELMQIHRLPIQRADEASVRAHLTTFRRLAAGYPILEQELGRAPEVLFLILDEQVTSSVWGDLAWSQVRAKVFSETLLEPLSAKVVLQDSLRKGFNGLPGDRRVHVNQALDCLSAHLDLDKPLPKAHTLKKLVTTEKLPSTHELYAWSNADARRLFGHYEDGRFLVDSLGAHL